MAEVVKMPRLSDTMEEGTIAKWLVKEGDEIEEGDILAEIETDKATMEFESFYDGVVLKIALKEGDSASVDEPIAVIGEEGEDIEGLLSGDAKEQSDDSDDSDEKDKEEDSSADEKDSDEENEKDEKKSDDDDSSEEEEEEDDDDDNDDEKSSDDKKEKSSGGEIPEGVEVITLPRLSDTMEEGSIASWLKQEGDEVEEGDILAEIETDKATMEFESFYDGILLKIILEEGDAAPVDEPIAIIGPEGTDVSGVLDAYKSGVENSSEEKKSDDKEKESSDQSDKEEKESSKDSSKKLKTKKDDTRIFASPLARKMAEDKNIDLADVEGSGENGRIVKKDIENYKPVEKETAKEETSKSTQEFVPAGEEAFEEVKNSQMRKTIAKRLAESQFGAPHFYLTVEINMENAMASRKAINNMPDTKISYNDMVIKASAMALRKHPQVNSIWSDDVTKIAKHIHIGVAVAVEAGLVVPVLKFTDQQSMTQINAHVKELAEKAHSKKIQPDEMEGSTFTVSNLGMFGIQEFTSIINQPNSAILSVGSIEEKPVVKDGEIVVGHTMKLTMACDHRTVDGATGAKFLQTLKTYLENPVTMLA